tara:strand:+ start:243 stop:506 length:264 start_codon:yes stop_codon:yes gene_type:complete
MSLTKQHFEFLAKILVDIYTIDFATVQDLKSFIKVEIKRFCYEHGKNFNGHTFESYITNHIEKALKEKRANGLIRLPDAVAHLIPKQ